MDGSLRRAVLGLAAAGALALGAPAAAHASAWSAVAKPAAAHNGHAAAIKASHLRTFKLDAAAMRATLAKAPKLALNARALSASDGEVVSLPAPNGKLERFSLQDAPVMEPELAALHPDIHTYAGRGIDDPTATIRADDTPLGFHASVRSDAGNWYIDPYYHGDTSLYASYYGQDLVNTHGTWVENEDVPEGPDPLGLGLKQAAADTSTVTLKTYRLALTSDQTYATYFGAANVTAAKVTLMNRVDQVYENELAIRMILIGQNDKLNLNTDALAINADGPCGAAGCFTSAQLASCGSSTLSRNRIVIGQIIGASNYDIGHIVVGQNGGGIASLGVVGGNNKAQGCTGIPTPQGDFFAVDYVAHEMGHEYGGNHTFEGLPDNNNNCGPGNRNAGTSVEPGSGSSIMAYAGICTNNDLQPHSDPYFSERSYDEIETYTGNARPAINEVQTASLDHFDGSDAFTLTYGNAITSPIVRGVNYSAAGIAAALQGPSEVQTVSLTGYDDSDTYTLDYKGVDSAPIVRGQNNTAAGIANVLQGGNEQQQVTLAGFSATTQSFQISLNGSTSPAFGVGGTTISNGNIAAAITSLMGCAATCASSTGAGNTGFTVTFNGSLANTDVPAMSIVNCSAACTSTVRTNAQGGQPLSSWPAGGTVTASTPTDAGYTLTFGGAFQGTDVDSVSVTNANGVTGAVTETTKGGVGMLPVGATAAVAAFGGNGTFGDTGFQVTFGGVLAGQAVQMLGINQSSGDGFSAFFGETAHGGAIQNQGFIRTDTGNHAPVVTTTPALTIPTRTPFSLTGSATDADNDPLTYMWEENDIGGGTAISLVDNNKTNGPLFRQFGTRAVVSPTDTLLSPSPGENNVDANPTRVFPDMAQVVADDTDAATGTCPTAPATNVPAPIVDCYSEFLPTSAWVGVLGDRTMNFRLTARDYHPNGGGIGSAATKVTIAPLAGPFRVTSATIAPSVYALSPQTVTWDVAGTDQPPVSASQVKISLSTDGGMTYPYVLATAVPNTGSARVVLPNVTAAAARFKVEAVGNVFFDISHQSFAIVPAPTTTVGGTVAPTLSLSLTGAAPTFGTFTPGVTSDYNASGTATVTSTAGDAALSVSDPDTSHPGHLINGGFFLPSALQAGANLGPLGTVSNTPLTVLTYNAPVSSDSVALNFRQHIERTDALRTGSYSKTLTFTLSTTTP